MAHEQILRRWPTLVGWLDELREFLTWKSEVEAARVDYENTPEAEKVTALLTGRKLLVAREWLSSNGDDLASEEKSFVILSIKAEDARSMQLQELRRLAEEGKLLIERERRLKAEKVAFTAKKHARSYRTAALAAILLAVIFGGSWYWDFYLRTIPCTVPITVSVGAYLSAWVR